MTIAKDFASKFAVAFVAVAMILMAFAPAVKAAETTEDLQATINDLLAQVAALQGQLGDEDAAPASSASCESIPAPLTMGSQGASVTALQNRLIADGQAIAAGATGYFGAQTKAALAAWQAANNVAPAAGYYGPLTMAAMDASCTPADEDEDTDEDEDSEDSDLSGEASLQDFTIDSASDDTVEEGSEDAEIAEVTVEFKDGDASISRMDVIVDDQDESTDPWDVLDTVSLWVDGENVGEIDASDEDNYLDETAGTLRITGLDIVAMEDEELDITIAATFQDGIDSADLDTYDVSVDALRFFDAADVATTEDSAYEIDDTVSFTLEEAGADDELAAKTSTEDPSATTLQLEDDAKSDWYTVFAFDLDTKDSVNNIVLNTVVVNVTSNGSTSADAGYADLVDDAELVIDGTTIDDVTVGGTSASEGTATLSFDVDGDVEIAAGERVTAELKLRFKSLVSTEEGATIQGSISSLTTSIVDAEGADDLANSQLSGSATGDEHTLRTSGAILEVTDVSETSKANTDSSLTDDEGIFVIEFDVTAFETDIYIDDNATRGTVESNTGVNYTLNVGGTATTAGSVVATLDSDAELDGARYLVNEGETESFTLTVEFDPNITGSYKLQLYSVNFNDTNADADTQQLATPAEDYDTDSLTI
jgi:hypothetical protein